MLLFMKDIQEPDDRCVHEGNCGILAAQYKVGKALVCEFLHGDIEDLYDVNSVLQLVWKSNRRRRRDLSRGSFSEKHNA